VKNQNT